MLGNAVDCPGFTMVTLTRHSFLNRTHDLDVYNITLLVNHMYVVKGTTACPLKGLEGTDWVPLLFPFVYIMLANHWKIVVLAEGKAGQYL